MKCQGVLFSAYRTDQYADPDGFMASLGLVFSQYPDDVVEYVTDPRTGVQRGKIFPPTIAEIVTALDERMANLARADRFRKWGQANISMLEAPRAERPTYDELKTKYGENWGINPAPDKPEKPAYKAPTPEELAAHYRDYDLGFKPKGETGK